MMEIKLVIEESPDKLSVYGDAADILDALAQWAQHPQLGAYFEGLAESARATEGLYQMMRSGERRENS